jgi:hypothetical protein
VTPSAASMVSPASAACSAIAVLERVPASTTYTGQAKDGLQPVPDPAAVPGIGDRVQDGQQVSAVPARDCARGARWPMAASAGDDDGEAGTVPRKVIRQCGNRHDHPDGHARAAAPVPGAARSYSAINRTSPTPCGRHAQPCGQLAASWARRSGPTLARTARCARCRPRARSCGSNDAHLRMSLSRSGRSLRPGRTPSPTQSAPCWPVAGAPAGRPSGQCLTCRHLPA